MQSVGEADTPAYEVLVYGPDPETGGTGGVRSHVRMVLAACRELGIPTQVWATGEDGVSRAVHSFFSAGRLFVRRGKHRVLHVNGTISRRGALRLLPLCTAARLSGVPVLLQLHGGRLAEARSTMTGRFAWGALLRLATVVGVFPGPQWEETEPLRRRVWFEQMWNMTRPADLGANTPTAAAHLLFLGRLVEDKRADVLLDAFEELCRTCSEPIKLTIAGDGPMLSALKARVRARALAPRVEVLGHLSGDALERVMRTANVMVLPSRQEGFPLSFLECAARGMACVVTKDSAIRELFVDGLEYVATDGSREDLVRRLRKLIEDRQERVRIGLNARDRVAREFTLKAAGPRFAHIYALLASKDARKSRRSAGSVVQR